MNQSLWSEWLNPTPVISAEIPTPEQAQRAHEWLFEKNADGGYVRAGLGIKIVYWRSYDLHCSHGGENTGIAALWSLFKQFEVKRGIPTRKSPLKLIPERKRAV